MENNELYQLRICLDGKVDYLGTLLNENKLHINKANVTELTFNSVEGHRLHTKLIFDPRSSKPKSLLIYSGNRTVCTKENDEYRLHEHKGNGARLTFETFVEQRRYKGLMFDFRQREVEFTRIYFRGWLNLLVTCDGDFTDLSFRALSCRVGYIEVVSDTRGREIETIRVRFDGERECLLTSEKLITLAYYITNPHGVNVSFGDDVHIKLKFSSQWRVYETFEFRKPDTNPEPINNLSELYEREAERRNERANGIKSVIDDFIFNWESATGTTISVNPVIDDQTGIPQSLEIRFTGEWPSTCKGDKGIMPCIDEFAVRFIHYVRLRLKQITDHEYSQEPVYGPKGVIFKLQEEPKQA